MSILSAIVRDTGAAAREGQDLPANATTTGTIAVGDTFDGGIGAAGDVDWIAVDLVAGQTVVVSVTGTGDTPLGNPEVEILDAAGTVLQQNDDSGPGRDPEAYFTAPEDGTYYIAVSDARGTNTGAYTLGLAAQAYPPLLDTLDWDGGTTGTPGADGTTVITVYFAEPGDTYDGYTSEGFNDYEIQQFMAAFATIEAVANVSFVVTDDPDADLRLVLDLDEISAEPDPFLGYFNPPGTRNEGVGVFNGAAWDREPGGSLDEGGYDFVTIVHELLHALGMSHPHDNGGGSLVMPGVESPFDDFGDYDLNQGVYTIMSYNTGSPTGTPGDAGDLFGYEAAPMALDIAVLQDKYGANTTTAAGDDVYALPDANAPGTAWLSIWDTGGIDTIRYDGTDDVIIDLRAATLQTEAGGGGILSQVVGIAGGYTIAAGVVIENAVGGGGDDLLTGNDEANFLVGRDGDDMLTGGAGRDGLFGGSGGDVFVFAVVGDGGTGRGQRDVIVGFDNDRDVIDLSGIDADASTEGDQALDFVGRDGFDGAGVGQVALTSGLSGGWSLVSVDADGDGFADLEILVTRDDGLDSDDFIL